MPASCPRHVPDESRHLRAARLCVAACGALALASACADMESRTMESLLDSWNGVPIDEAKVQWGPPQAVQSVPGGTAYVWSDASAATPAPDSEQRAAADAGLSPAPGHCERILVAGPEGTVVRGEWRGDACCTTMLNHFCAGLRHRATVPRADDIWPAHQDVLTPASPSVDVSGIAASCGAPAGQAPVPASHGEYSPKLHRSGSTRGRRTTRSTCRRTTRSAPA